MTRPTFWLTLLVPLVLALGAAGCGGKSRGGGAGAPAAAAPAPSASPSPAPIDDLAALSDAFSDPARLGEWQRVYQVEQWGFDQLETLEVGASQPGWLTLEPRSSSWYGDYRGVLMFKPVQGDFQVTTRVVSTGRSGAGAPGRLYSLAGIMVRAPRAVTPATWTRGGEDYVFFSVGAANAPGTFQTEIKTTHDSVSTLEIGQAAGAEAWLRVARVGSVVLALVREAGTPWRVHRRFQRGDLPATLQVGLTVYTDWDTVAAVTPEYHNTHPLSGTPDLRARFDFVDYARPAVPAALAGRDLADPASVSDGELLSFLGL